MCWLSQVVERRRGFRFDEENQGGSNPPFQVRYFLVCYFLGLTAPCIVRKLIRGFVLRPPPVRLLNSLGSEGKPSSQPIVATAAVRARNGSAAS